MEKLRVKNEFFEIMNANGDTLGGIMEKELPTKLSYWISRNIQKLQSEAKDYFDSKQKLIEKYKKEEQNKELPEGQIELSNPEAFMKEVLELQDIVVETSINMIELDLDEDVRFKPRELMLLPFLEIKE